MKKNGVFTLFPLLSQNVENFFHEKSGKKW
jgi:hypothetical protein